MGSQHCLTLFKRAAFATAFASVRTFDPYAPANVVGQLAERACGVAAAAVSSPEMLKTEQRWLMGTGCPYDLTSAARL